MYIFMKRFSITNMIDPIPIYPEIKKVDSTECVLKVSWSNWFIIGEVNCPKNEKQETIANERVTSFLELSNDV